MQKKVSSCLLLAAAVVGLSACAGELGDPEFRKQATFHIIAGVKKCSNDQYLRVAENPDTKQGWKMQYEYMCKEIADKEGMKSIDGEIYSKDVLKAASEEDQYTRVLLWPY
jgi:hypothetical protein